MKAYAELHCISNFSFLRGASHPEELLEQAHYLGYSALALTDECSLAGVVKAEVRRRELNADIKLIIGSEFVVSGEGVLVVLAPNRQAYAELSQFITLCRRESPKGEYAFSWSKLQGHLQSCLLLFKPGGFECAMRVLPPLCKEFKDRLWLLGEKGLSSDEESYLYQLKRLSSELALPIVAAGNVTMHSAERLPLLHILHAIAQHKPLSECLSELAVNAEGAMRDLDKLTRLYPDAWLRESLKVAHLCDFSLSELSYEYPRELVPDDHTPDAYLRTLVYQGANKRFASAIPRDIKALLEKELALIAELEYEYFFLTLYDVVRFAREQNIYCQGRGSAANSVVCYCLFITEVDPRQIQVLFERFISRERNEPPDIDVDFEHERREEVIQYIYRKYGRERAALAASVVCYKFKSAFAEVGKALGFNEYELSATVKRLDRRDKAQSWCEQLAQLDFSGEDIRKRTQLIDLVNTLIGFPRHLSQHVGGFVISAGPLHALVPIENAAMQGRTVIQWDKDDIEALGLLKLDILALGMLTALRKCLHYVNTWHGDNVLLADINRSDPEVFHMLQRGDSIGVFQVESRAQSAMLPRLKPDCFYDLVVQIAIVRPGPIQGNMVHPYLKRRAGKEVVSYPSKAVESVLSRTLGVPIFQEQVIQLAMVAAGFSGGEADALRRAMASWKRQGELEKYRERLISGMLHRGYQAEFAERIYRQICGFGEYGFPESHSASFANLAYASAWLKCYYPAAFCCALLNSQPMGFYTPSQLIQDLKRHQVKVFPVDINRSDWAHKLERDDEGKTGLRLGFRLIKGLTLEAVSELIRVRPETGFENLDELMAIELAPGVLENLASANALTPLAGHRHQARWQCTRLSPQLDLLSQSESSVQVSLPAPSHGQALLEDIASTGVTLGPHIMQLLAQSPDLGRRVQASCLIRVKHGTKVTVVGIVTGRQRPGTASGVTFLTLEDETGNINVIVWEATARAQRAAFLQSRLLRVDGVLEVEGDVAHIIAGKLSDLSELVPQLSVVSRDFR